MRRFAPRRQLTATIDVNPAKRYQTIDGFGVAMTGSAAYLISQSPSRDAILNALFGPNGNRFNLVRSPMASTDMSLNAYSYDDVPASATRAILSSGTVTRRRRRPPGSCAPASATGSPIPTATPAGRARCAGPDVLPSYVLDSLPDHTGQQAQCIPPASSLEGHIVQWDGDTRQKTAWPCAPASATGSPIPTASAEGQGAPGPDVLPSMCSTRCRTRPGSRRSAFRPRRASRAILSSGPVTRRRRPPGWCAPASATGSPIPTATPAGRARVRRVRTCSVVCARLAAGPDRAAGAVHSARVEPRGPYCPVGR